MNDITAILLETRDYFLWLPLLCIIFIFSITLWKKLQKKFNLNQYQAIQKIHNYETSRLGGFAIFLFLLFATSAKIIESKFIEASLISLLPILLISLREDLYQDTKPILRILSMIASSSTFFYIYSLNFPKIDLPYVDLLFNSFLFSFIFYTFCSVLIMNGKNLIDGSNGLAGFSIISQLFVIFILSQKLGYFDIQISVILILIPALLFIFFNYPLGKIFFGDFGVYMYGFFISMIIIDIFGRSDELLSWGAIVIIIYPAFEVLFSVIRKKNFFKADNLHLHTIIFKLLNKKLNNNYSNNLTALCLSFFWLSPLCYLFLMDSLLSILLFIILFSVLYTTLYYFLRKKI